MMMVNCNQKRVSRSDASGNSALKLGGVAALCALVAVGCNRNNAAAEAERSEAPAAAEDRTMTRTLDAAKGDDAATNVQGSQGSPSVPGAGLGTDDDQAKGAGQGSGQTTSQAIGADRVSGEGSAASPMAGAGKSGSGSASGGSGGRTGGTGGRSSGTAGRSGSTGGAGGSTAGAR